MIFSAIRSFSIKDVIVMVEQGSCVASGYAPPVYSYSLSCVECADYSYNWMKYVAAAF